MRKCAIYCRVSTEEQNPEHQQKALEQYAKNNDYEVFRVYIDKTSGKTDTRPMLNQMLFDGRNRLFDMVLIWKLDRLGRSLKHLLNIAEEWQKRGIDFVSITQGFDTSTASGKMVFQILGAIAEFERELISERTKEGLKHALNVGKRGKDKNPRRKSGYYLRHAKQRGGMEIAPLISITGP